MSRQIKLQMRFNDAQNSGKTIIAKKVAAFLAFYNIDMRQMDEHHYEISYNRRDLDNLAQSK